MTNGTVVRDESINSPRMIRSVYNVIAQLPSFNEGSGWGQPPFPSFVELFEEFVAQAIEERTSLSRKEIDVELLELERMDALDVEKGFRINEIAINAELELYSTLMALNYTFVYKGEVINPPIQEVW